MQGITSVDEALARLEKTPEVTDTLRDFGGLGMDVALSADAGVAHRDSQLSLNMCVSCWQSLTSRAISVGSDRAPLTFLAVQHVEVDFSTSALTGN